MICLRVPASIFLFCSTATCFNASTWRYLASTVGLLMTTSVSPCFTHWPSSTRKVSMRPGSLPLMRISVASACPCKTRGWWRMAIIPMTVKSATATSTTMNAILKVLPFLDSEFSISYYYFIGYSVHSISISFLLFSVMGREVTFFMLPNCSGIPHSASRFISVTSYS